MSDTARAQGQYWGERARPFTCERKRISKDSSSDWSLQGPSQETY